MSGSPELIRVDPSAIEENRPLAYAIFTVDGALLAAPGARIRDASKLGILRQEGWRQADAIAERLGVAERPPAPRPMEPARLAPIPPVALSEATVLVADDMALARSLLTGILLELGVGRVTAVEDGRQAITRFFSETPHLVFLDIDMPRMDGLGALKQIKSWAPGVFVGLVSANSTRSNVQVALSHQVDAFLVKPYSALNMKRVLARYESRLGELAT